MNTTCIGMSYKSVSVAVIVINIFLLAENETFEVPKRLERLVLSLEVELVPNIGAPSLLAEVVEVTSLRLNLAHTTLYIFLIVNT